MSNQNKTAVIVGGSSGIGLALAKTLAARGETVVLTSRDTARAEAAARSVGHGATGLAVDLAEPGQIADKFASIGPVDHLIIGAIERDQNSIKTYSVERALRLVTIKLVGYAEAIHALATRFTPEASIVLFGGQARERPYPGSTTVTSVNGGITAMIRTLAIELAPLRVNAIHPGVVGDSPAWSGNPEARERARSRTPTGRLATQADCVGATLFLLDNQAVNAVNLVVDGGWTLS